MLYEHHLITLANVNFCKKVGLPKDTVLCHHVHYFIPMENRDVPHQVLKVGGLFPMFPLTIAGLRQAVNTCWETNEYMDKYFS